MNQTNQIKTNARIRIELYQDGILAAAAGNYMDTLPRQEVAQRLWTGPVSSIIETNKTSVKGIIQSCETGVVLYQIEDEITDAGKIKEAIGNMTVRVNVEVERLKMQRSIRPLP